MWFSLFENKRELLLAALERGFERLADTPSGAPRLTTARAGSRRLRGHHAGDGLAYRALLASDRDHLPVNPGRARYLSRPPGDSISRLENSLI
jgi:transposase